MLLGLPHALLTSLTARIGEGSDRGRIDMHGLVALMAEHEQAGNLRSLDATWEQQALFWAKERLAAVPAHAAVVGIVRQDTADPWPAGDPAGGSQKPRGSGPDALLYAPMGLPDVMTTAMAAALLARHGAWQAELLVHPELSSAACAQRGKKRGRALLGLLAEMGLAGRPWHLWLGPSAPVEMLSPYVRDLGEALWRWGQEQHLVAWDEPWDADSHCPEQYALAEAFVASHPDLAQERAAAERTVGITRARLGGLSVAIIDLGRSSAEVRDPRLAHGAFAALADGAVAPLLLQINHGHAGDDERAMAAMVSRICQSIGGQALSITVCSPGVLRDEDRAELSASAVLRVAGQCPLAMNHTDATRGAGCVDALPWTLDALAHNGSDDAGPQWPEDEEGPARAAAWVGGDAIVWAAVARLIHKGALPLNTPAALHVHRAHDDHAIDAMALRVLQGLMVTAKLQAAKEKKPHSSKHHRVRV